MFGCIGIIPSHTDLSQIILAHMISGMERLVPREPNRAVIEVKKLHRRVWSKSFWVRLYMFYQRLSFTGKVFSSLVEYFLESSKDPQGGRLKALVWFW
jgi:hypothetical protein